MITADGFTHWKPLPCSALTQRTSTHSAYTCKLKNIDSYDYFYKHLPGLIDLITLIRNLHLDKLYVDGISYLFFCNAYDNKNELAVLCIHFGFHEKQGKQTD